MPQFKTAAECGECGGCDKPLAKCVWCGSYSDEHDAIGRTAKDDCPKELEGDPALVNRDAESGAWFMKVKLSNPAELDELMDKAAYDKLVNG